MKRKKPLIYDRPWDKRFLISLDVVVDVLEHIDLLMN